MKIFKKLFAKIVPKNEDDGFYDHIVRQKSAPFYCGTSFCGHATKKFARLCWKTKCDAIEQLRKQGASQQEYDKFYPERDPNNWPVNRSSLAMSIEYLKRAEIESSS